MRLFLTLSLFLPITLSVAAIVVPVVAPAAVDGVAGESAAGELTAGDDGITSPSNAGDESGSTTPEKIDPSDTEPPSLSSPANDDENSAADTNELIQSYLDALSSIVVTSDSTTYTTTTPLPTAAQPCISARSIYNACARNDNDDGTSGAVDFTDQVVSQQASCLCYEGVGSGNETAATSWAPSLFDGYVSRCDAFVATQTVVSLSASASVTATGICASVGNVRASASASVAAATSSSTAAAGVSPATSGGVGRSVAVDYIGIVLVFGIIFG